MSNGVPAPGKYWIWTNRIFCWILGYFVGNWYGCDKLLNLYSARIVIAESDHAHSIPSHSPHWKSQKQDAESIASPLELFDKITHKSRLPPAATPSKDWKGSDFILTIGFTSETNFSTSLHHWISSPKKDQNYFFINFKNRICHDLTQLAVTSLGACEKPRLYMLFIDPRSSMVLESLP